MTSTARVRLARGLDVLLILAAIATLAAAAAALGARLWWGFELFSHFRLQYVLVQLPLTAALLLRRQRGFAAAVALAVVPNALPLLPYLPHPVAAAKGAAGAEPLKLVAVNVEADNRSHERLLEIVAAEAPDVLLVVELTAAWRERLRPLDAAFPYRILLPDRGAFGVGLFSRYPLEDARTFRLESTHAVDARISAPAGDLRLIGVHLRPPTTRPFAAERARQLEALAALTRRIDGPLVIAGDFNVTPYSPHFADWLRATGMRDAREGFGPGTSWPTFLPILGIPIDHCTVSAELSVASFKRLPAFGSDHYPIAVELMLGSDS